PVDRAVRPPRPRHRRSRVHALEGPRGLRGHVRGGHQGWRRGRGLSTGSTVLRRTLLAVVVGGVALLVVALGSALVPARGDAPDRLSVYAGRGIATPLGVVSRVPAESAGGIIYSESRLEIGK